MLHVTCHMLQIGHNLLHAPTPHVRDQLPHTFRNLTTGPGGMREALLIMLRSQLAWTQDKIRQGHLPMQICKFTLEPKNATATRKQTIIAGAQGQRGKPRKQEGKGWRKHRDTNETDTHKTEETPRQDKKINNKHKTQTQRPSKTTDKPTTKREKEATKLDKHLCDQILAPECNPARQSQTRPHQKPARQ